MKTYVLQLSLSLILLLNGCNEVTSDRQHVINPIIGDIRYTEKYGDVPDQFTDETLRIKAHLEYVENLLRAKDISGLSHALKAKRENLLDLLHQYWTAAVFPKNYDYSNERKPCFIDKDGNICAVGYLLEQTAG